MGGLGDGGGSSAAAPIGSRDSGRCAASIAVDALSTAVSVGGLCSVPEFVGSVFACYLRPALVAVRGMGWGRGGGRGGMKEGKRGGEGREGERKRGGRGGRKDEGQAEGRWKGERKGGGEGRERREGRRERGREEFG